MARTHVLCSLLFVQLSFGCYSILLKKYAQQEKADPLVYSAARDAGAFPILLIAAYFFEGWHPPTTTNQLLLFALLGAAGMAGNQLFNIMGLFYTSPSTAAIFQPMIPVLTAALSMLIGIEPFPNIATLPGRAKVFGILSAVVGAMIMVRAAGGQGQTAMLNPIRGILYLMGNITCMAIYIVMQKMFIFSTSGRAGARRKAGPFIDRMCLAAVGYDVRPVTVTAWAYGFGGFFMALSCLSYLPDRKDLFVIPHNTWIPLTYAIFVASALNYGIISWANSQLHPSLVTAMWPLQVPTVVFLSYVIFGEALTHAQLLGGLLIACGLISVTWADYSQSSVSRRVSTDHLMPAKESETLAKRGDVDISLEDPPSTVSELIVQSFTEREHVD